MYQIVPVSASPPEMARFCAAAGQPLRPEVVAHHAPDLSFLVENAAGAVARCSLWWRHTPTHEGRTVGYIGHYAVAAADPGAAPILLGRACEELARQGCTLAVGPVDGNTWQRYRLITERGSEPPFFLEPDNPDEWPGQFTAAGFTPLAQYYSALNSDLAQDDPSIAKAQMSVQEHGISIRALRLEDFDAELRRVHALSLLSFRNNFLYSPISEADFLAQYTPIRAHMRPDLVLLAERGDELVGFVFAIPDLLRAQQGRPMDTIVLKTLAVRPDQGGIGLGSLLMARCHEAARTAGFHCAIHALFHEANRSGKISAHTARVIRRYTLFSRPASG